MASMIVYTTAKHAVLGLIRTAAIEYGKQGILINAISLGGVESLRPSAVLQRARQRLTSVYQEEIS